METGGRTWTAAIKGANDSFRGIKTCPWLVLLHRRERWKSVRMRMAYEACKKKEDKL